MRDKLIVKSKLCYIENQRVNSVKGSYIVYLNADDHWLLDKREKQLRVMLY